MAINRTGPQLTAKNRLIAVTNRLTLKKMKTVYKQLKAVKLKFFLTGKIIATHFSFKMSPRTLNLVKISHIYDNIRIS
jgi:hypothetical protein